MTNPHPAPLSYADVLLTRAACGDRRAFAELYDLAVAAVHSLVLRVLRDPELSSEATRSVWVWVWRSAGEYSPEQGCAMTWILARAHQHVVERFLPALGTSAPWVDPQCHPWD